MVTMIEQCCDGNWSWCCVVYFREYIENIRYIDKGIRQMENL